MDERRCINPQNSGTASDGQHPVTCPDPFPRESPSIPPTGKDRILIGLTRGKAGRSPEHAL